MDAPESEPSTAAPAPDPPQQEEDIMNDPAHDPATRSPTKGNKEEADTCRICRGEGSPEEPLFYPCKCSGSIKFVHQDCLMEWLSHSQKKHCELCKTPFHFTKLYSPHMPSKLPTGIFIKRAALHILSHLGTWLRGLMVGTVWLLAVPWVMRYAWRVMFWVGDAGWARDGRYILPLLQELHENAPTKAEGLLPADHTASNTSVQPMPVVDFALRKIGYTGEPVAYRLLKWTVTHLAAPLRRSETFTVSTNSTGDPIVLRMIEQSQSSVLSNIDSLQNLTSAPAFNRFVMDILEGQIITLTVVIVCILVFLIREWVVQQQPVVELAGADADNALAQAGGVAQNENGQEQPPAGQVDGANDDAERPLNPIIENLKTQVVGPHEIQTRFEMLEGHIAGHLEHIAEDRRESLQRDLEGIREMAREREEAVKSQLMSEAVNLEELREALGSAHPARPLLDGLIAEVYRDIREADAEGNLESWEEPASSGRPTMPSRSRSGIALDVARDMEERGHGEQGAEEELGQGSTQAVDEEHYNDNGNSSGSSSWQHVSDSEREKAETAERAVDDGHTAQGEGSQWSTEGHDSDEEHPPEAPGETLDALHVGELRDIVNAELDQAQDEDNADNHEVEADGEAPTDADAPAAEAQEQPPPNGMLDHLINWYWGDIAPAPDNGALGEAGGEDPDDEQVVRNVADEAPFVPFHDGQIVQDLAQGPDGDEPIPPPANPDINANRNADVGNADAGQDGALAGDLEALEAMEDAEDIEGILELIGMQGPVIGLIQNATLSSILISISLVLCVFVPYVWGKVVLLHVAEPSLLYRVPLKTSTIIADLAIDAVLAVAGGIFYLVSKIFELAAMLVPFSVDLTKRQSYQYVLDIRRVAKGALERLIGGVGSAQDIEAGDFLQLSMACHAALYYVESLITEKADAIREALAAIYQGIISADIALISATAANAEKGLVDVVSPFVSGLWTAIKSFYTTGSIPISMGASLVIPDDPMLTYWSAKDRALAILAGYAAIGTICALYVKVAPISSSPRARRVESYIVEGCLQAGGVLKVILIISIEMIAFPLFCGFLLDFALMPLFESASFSSRIAFTLSSPWTSGFVHWFVGTCYMFHFALFVSMCRRILRTGVLYFIRDPDDPTFHPVRDVLERNVITQLRKIAFSAIVYGALIVVCLGGIVWGMYAATRNVLPIRWSSTGSNIEFPLDILFYNFLTPFVVHYAQPSKGITAMYGWWFRKAARALRLSDFLFGDSIFDEEGSWVRHTWKAFLTRRINTDLGEEDLNRPALAAGTANPEDLDDGIVRFVPDGRYVRAPNSDQVRIPKSTPVFVPVNSANERQDGKPEDEGVHAQSSAMVTRVYIPPWFRVRIGLFVVAVWLFAAATGICVTIVPLLFGRYLLTRTLGTVEGGVNDIYAFSLGIYILGSVLYSVIHRARILTWAHATFIPTNHSLRVLAASTLNAVKRALSALYVYTALAIGLPLINALILEVYVLMPLHYFFDNREHHVMHLIQDWTLGILYVRIGMRIFLFDAQSRPARAIRAVFAQGYLRPDAWLATRYFILPAIVGVVMLMGLPFLAATAVTKTLYAGGDEEEKTRVMRMTYPLASGGVVVWFVGRKVGQIAGRWRARIRDEVYLVGERLHNFGERSRKAKDVKGKGGLREEVAVE